jgi:hypothetical protein
MFGFSKSFAIAVFIAIIVSLGMRDYKIGLQIVIIFGLAKIVWNILTK